MKILLITPPLVQTNTPYAAMPVLAGYLQSLGHTVIQADLSLELVLAAFSRVGLDAAYQAACKLARPSLHVQRFREQIAAYRCGMEHVVPFLQGGAPELAWSLSRPDFLPENTHFRELDPSEEGLEDETLQACFGFMGLTDHAKLLASLFLDDVSQVYQETLDPHFGFSKYAEHLAVAAPIFDPILKRLRTPNPTWMDQQIDRITAEQIRQHQPEMVGITCPFPGTVYGAFRVAQKIRECAPKTRLVLGGGYVNSELRDLTDTRVFDFFDTICFDDGFEPWRSILGLRPPCSIQTREGKAPPQERHAGGVYEVRVSDYTGLPLSQYLSLLETTTPLHRLWSEGRWMKVQLSNGCYWHRCAFCDVALDYIGDFAAADAKQAVDALLAMKQKTGLSTFHFTDEALPPNVVRGLCEELIRRQESLIWWGNIRFDAAFTPALIARMAEAGCIAVSAGLECAQNRLLKLMNKGITCEKARTLCRHLSEAGIRVHTYLMYGFPTETEAETLEALKFVRDLFAEGVIQSAFWHRFALTIHSPIARNPEAFGIQLKPLPSLPRRFALNEIAYEEPAAPDLERLGRGLFTATYNYMRGVGLELPIRQWFATSP